MKPNALNMFFLFVYFLAVLCPRSSSQEISQIKTFEAPGAGMAAGQGTVARSINLTGEITGEYYDPSVAVHGFVRVSGGQITALDISGAGTGNGQGTFPRSINASGEIAGFYYDAQHLVTRGFVVDPSGTVTTFDNGLALSINSNGVSTGPYSNQQGFVRDRNGSITTFQAGPFGTFPQRINDAGEVTGFYVDLNFAAHGFLREPDGGIVQFNAGPSSNQTFPTDVNGDGLIVGSVTDSATGATHGFMREKNGHIRIFDAGQNGTFPQAINSCGVISGYFFDANKLARGFVRRLHGRVITFEVPGAGGPFFGDGTLPQSSNQAGQVTGYYTDSSGSYHAFLRQPDPGLKPCEDDE